MGSDEREAEGAPPVDHDEHDPRCECFDCYLLASEAAQDRADVVAKEMDK